MGSREETELLRCMLSKRMDVSFPKTKRPSCWKEVEMFISSPFIRTGGKFWLC